MNLTSMHISLPEPLCRFIEEQVDLGGYDSASGYVRDLILDAHRMAERAALETKLLAGLEAPATDLIDDDWRALRERIRRRSTALRNQS